MDLLIEIRKILASVSIKSEETIELSDNLEADLGIDSFGTVEIAVQLEDKYNISIKDKELRIFCTVQDVLDYVASHAIALSN